MVHELSATCNRHTWSLFAVNSYVTIVSVGALTCLSTYRMAKLADLFDIVSLVWLTSDSNKLDGIRFRFLLLFFPCDLYSQLIFTVIIIVGLVNYNRYT